MKSRIPKPTPDSVSPEYDPHLKATLLEVVDNQIRDNNPPETRETLERLISAGHTEQ